MQHVSGSRREACLPWDRGLIVASLQGEPVRIGDERGEHIMVRRLVGIDLGIASAHTVRVLDETGATVAKRKAVPTVESLAAIEEVALAGCPEGTLLEVVMEPTGPLNPMIRASALTRL